MSLEHDRMRRGERYDSRDPALLATAHRARALLAAYAATASTDAAGRRDILARLLGTVGDDVWIEPPFFVDYGENVSIGAGTIVLAGVTIGDNVTIGAGSLVTTDVPSNSLALGHPCRVVRSL